MMTKSDLEAIAGIFRAETERDRELVRAGGISPMDQTERLVSRAHLRARFMDYATSVNPRFDRERFLAATNPSN